jgi:hypothetical protein
MFDSSRTEAIIAEHLYRKMQAKADYYKGCRDASDQAFFALHDHVHRCVKIADQALENIPGEEEIEKPLLIGIILPIFIQLDVDVGFTHAGSHSVWDGVNFKDSHSGTPALRRHLSPRAQAVSATIALLRVADMIRIQI